MRAVRVTPVGLALLAAVPTAYAADYLGAEAALKQAQRQSTPENNPVGQLWAELEQLQQSSAQMPSAEAAKTWLALAEQNQITANLVRLDPLSRHERGETGFSGDLRALWTAVESVTKSRPAVMDDKLMPPDGERQAGGDHCGSASGVSHAAGAEAAAADDVSRHGPDDVDGKCGRGWRRRAHSR